MTCRACWNHLSDVPEPRGGLSRIACWACATTSEMYQNHVPDNLETRTGQTGTTCRPRLNHLPSTTEPPAGLAKNTCGLCQNHLEDSPG